MSKYTEFFLFNVSDLTQMESPAYNSTIFTWSLEVMIKLLNYGILLFVDFTSFGFEIKHANITHKEKGSLYNCSFRGCNNAFHVPRLL